MSGEHLRQSTSWLHSGKYSLFGISNAGDIVGVENIALIFFTDTLPFSRGQFTLVDVRALWNVSNDGHRLDTNVAPTSQ